jgi:hypothetical protein
MGISDPRFRAKLAKAVEVDTVIGADDPQIVIAEVTIADELDGLSLEIEKDDGHRTGSRGEKLVEDAAEDHELTPT